MVSEFEVFDAWSVVVICIYFVGFVVHFCSIILSGFKYQNGRILENGTKTILQDYGTQELSSSSNLDDSDSEASHADSGSECSDDEEEEDSLEKLREGRDFKVDVLLEMAANTVVHNVEAHREQAYVKVIVTHT